MDGGGGLRRIVADEYALAGGQSVGLDHPGAGVAAQVVEGGGLVMEYRELRAGGAGFFHQSPGETLAGLQPGGGAGGTEHRDARRLQGVGQPVGQGGFGADDHQVRRYLAGGGGDGRHIGAHGDVFRQRRSAIVAGRSP